MSRFLDGTAGSSGGGARAAIHSRLGSALGSHQCVAQPLPKVEVPISGKLRLDGVTLVDTHDGTLTPGMSILMDKGSIVSVTPITEVSKDPSIMSIDATGRFAIPGFNNMHVHVIEQANSSSVLAGMLADGVTGFRQMTGSPELLKERRDGTLPIGNDAPALLVSFALAEGRLNSSG